MERGGRDEPPRLFFRQSVSTPDPPRYFCHSCSTEFFQSSNQGASAISCTNCGSQFIEEVNSDVDLQVISNQIHRLLTIMTNEGDLTTIQQNDTNGNTLEDPLSLARRLIVLEDYSSDGGSSQSSLNSSMHLPYQPLILSSTPSTQTSDSNHTDPGGIQPGISSGQRLRLLIRSMITLGRQTFRGSTVREASDRLQELFHPLPPTHNTVHPTSPPPVTHPTIDRGLDQINPRVVDSGSDGEESERSAGRPAGRQISPTEAIVSGAAIHGSRVGMDAGPEELAVSAVGVRRPMNRPVGRIEESRVVHVGGASSIQGNDQQSVRLNMLNDLRSAQPGNDDIERRRLSEGRIELIRQPNSDPNLVLLLSLIGRLSRLNDQGSQILRSGSENTTNVRHLSDYAFSTSAFERILTQFLNDLNDTGPSPASATAISNLAVVPVTEELLDAARQCIVCMEDFTLKEPVNQLPCHHVYHIDCIKTWLQLHGTCPVCRLNLPAVAASESQE